MKLTKIYIFIKLQLLTIFGNHYKICFYFVLFFASCELLIICTSLSITAIFFFLSTYREDKMFWFFCTVQLLWKMISKLIFWDISFSCKTLRIIVLARFTLFCCSKGLYSFLIIDGTRLCSCVVDQGALTYTSAGCTDTSISGKGLSVTISL